MYNENVVNAYNYGGLICGESKGNASNVEIIGTGEYLSTLPANVPTTLVLEKETTLGKIVKFITVPTELFALKEI